MNGDTAEVTMAGSRTAPLRRPDVRTLPLSSLAPAAWRARGMTQLMLEGFRRSLDRFGAARLPLWNSRTCDLVDGHELVRAMIDDGLAETPAVVVDLSPEEAKALAIELHRWAGAWDPGGLAAIIAEIKAGAPETYDRLRLLDMEIDARLEIIRNTRPEDLPGQRRLFT